MSCKDTLDYVTGLWERKACLQTPSTDFSPWFWGVLHRPEGHRTTISCLEDFNSPLTGLPSSCLPHLSQRTSDLTASVLEAFNGSHCPRIKCTPHDKVFMILLLLTSPDISFQPERTRSSKFCLACGSLHMLFAPPGKFTSPATSPHPKSASLLFIFRCQLHCYLVLMPDHSHPWLAQ